MIHMLRANEKIKYHETNNIYNIKACLQRSASAVCTNPWRQSSCWAPQTTKLMCSGHLMHLVLRQIMCGEFWVVKVVKRKCKASLIISILWMNVTVKQAKLVLFLSFFVSGVDSRCVVCMLWVISSPWLIKVSMLSCEHPLRMQAHYIHNELWNRQLLIDTSSIVPACVSVCVCACAGWRDLAGVDVWFCTDVFSRVWIDPADRFTHS